MSYTNETLPTSRDLTHEELRDECARWKRRAERYEEMLRNIPDALRQFGHWDITIDGEKTYAILDPERHPPQPHTEGEVDPVFLTDEPSLRRNPNE